MNGFGKSKLGANATCHQSGWKILEGDPSLLGPSLCLFPHVCRLLKVVAVKALPKKTKDPHIEVHHLFRWSLTVTKTMLAKGANVLCVFKITKTYDRTCRKEGLDPDVWRGIDSCRHWLRYLHSSKSSRWQYLLLSCTLPETNKSAWNPTGNEAKKTIHFQRLCWFWEVFFQNVLLLLHLQILTLAGATACRWPITGWGHKSVMCWNIRMTIKMLVEGGPFWFALGMKHGFQQFFSQTCCMFVFVCGWGPKIWQWASDRSYNQNLWCNFTNFCCSRYNLSIDT